MAPVRHLLLLILLLGGNWGFAGPAAAQSGGQTLGQAGYIVIENGRDAAGFRWQEGPGPGRHSLVWPEGTLSLPDSLELDEFGPHDAGIVCRAELSGVGGSGQLVFQDGVYQVSEPLLLADGVLELHVSAGELIVRGSQIRYRRPHSEDRKTRANFIFLAGMMVLIIVLLRRARSRLRKS